MTHTKQQRLEASTPMHIVVLSTLRSRARPSTFFRPLRLLLVTFLRKTRENKTKLKLFDGVTRKTSD